MAEPEVSIIIPCYNRPEKLKRTLESIAKACSKPHEVLLFDDSSDGSNFNTAKEANARYFYKAGKNKGQANSRNLGIKLAKGKYIYFIDDDDLVNPGMVDNLCDAMDDNISFVYGDYSYMKNDSEESHSLSNLTTDKLRDMMLVMNRIPIGGFLIKKSAIKSMFDTKLKSHEDWDFLLSNIDWAKVKYVDKSIVTIDKTSEDSYSNARLEKGKFGVDFLIIYNKHPAKYLEEERNKKLIEMGIDKDKIKTELPKNFREGGRVRII